jgi:hypothetical protein
MNNIFLVPKIVPSIKYVEKYCITRQATDDNMAHVHCMLDTKGYKYTGRICSIPYLLFLCYNKVCTNVPQCYAMPTLSVLLVIFCIPILI